MMNRNDPTNKRVCVHHDASCHVVVSREFVVVILFISFSHLQFSSHSCIYMFNSPTLQLLTDSRC